MDSHILPDPVDRVAECWEGPEVERLDVWEWEEQGGEWFPGASTWETAARPCPTFNTSNLPCLEGSVKLGGAEVGGDKR